MYFVTDRIKLIIFSMTLLTVGMGLGRFVYTAMFPIMLVESSFDFSQLSYIASSNYTGYLAGALLFSLGYWHHQAQVKRNFLTCLVITTFLLLLMAYDFTYYGILIIRFLAGVASAGVIIFGSMMILALTTNPIIVGSFFSGVGTGILIGNELIALGVAFDLSSQPLWLGIGILSGLIVLMTECFYPIQNNKPLKAHPAATTIKEELIPWFSLVILYGLAGFGYIITATYLPVIAKELQASFMTQHLWSLLDLGAIISCFLWLYIQSKWGTFIALIANLLSQSVFVFISYFSYIETLLIISALGVGLTFMGTTVLVMTLAKQTQSPKWLNLLGLVTLSYSLGQILGPVFTNRIQQCTGTIDLALLWAGFALFASALIVIYYWLKAQKAQKTQ